MLLRPTFGCKRPLQGTQRAAHACVTTTTRRSAVLQQPVADATHLDPSRLIFYDISSPLERSYAPNPAKARLALSFKRVPFKTTWVDILDIADLRKELRCPAARKFDDGSDYYTLPMLQDLNAGRVVGDSFDIANYLEEEFADFGECLFPEDSTRHGLDYESPHKDAAVFAPLVPNAGNSNLEYARFNQHVDTTFSAHVLLFVQYLPFVPATAEAVRSLFVKRAHVKSWDDLCIQGEARGQLKAAFKDALTSLAELFMVHDTGPYLEGSRATYADLIVGGWLIMLCATLPEEEWEDFRSWHGGVFGRLHDALQHNYLA